VPQGTYRLRAAATDATGRRGAVDTELAAEPTIAGPLQISAIMLGTSDPLTPFRPRLEFYNEASATAYLEVYSGLPYSGTLAIAWDIAKTPDGPALASAPAVTSATNDPDRRIARGTLPIGPLPAGDYIVRASITIDGKVVGRVMGTLRKTDGSGARRTGAQDAGARIAGARGAGAAWPERR